MLIVAGVQRSRKLETLEGDNTRPTLDKVKEAVFSSLGGKFYEGSILDLFGGCGSIALEAISRGMEKAVIVDNNYDAVQVIRRNVASLKEEDKVSVWKLDYKKAIKRCEEENLKFDLIYLDPPYRKGWYNEILQRITESSLLKEDGRIVCESLKEEVLDAKGLVVYKEAVYGIMKVSYLRRSEEHE